MNATKILIVPKITKVEWDMHRLNLTEKELYKFYKSESLDAEKIFERHRKQKENLEKIKKILPNSKIVERDSLTKDEAKNSTLVIAFGGDNHFEYVSHFLDNIPILGINSDPEKSEGALTSITVRELDKILPSLLNQKFEIEEWTRLKVEVDDKEIEELAIEGIFIGEERRFNMSRHILKLNEKSEEQKGSGLLVTTGAGSTGWYNSASRYIFPEGDVFSKSKKEARFILTEPYNGRLSSLGMINGSIKENEELEVISLSDSSAYLSVDSLRLIKLREGAKIKVKIGNTLKVVKNEIH